MKVVSHRIEKGGKCDFHQDEVRIVPIYEDGTEGIMWMIPTSKGWDLKTYIGMWEMTEDDISMIKMISGGKEVIESYPHELHTL